MPSKPKDCIFCSIMDSGDKVAENDSFFAVRDLYPVSRGHTLVISKRHYPSLLEAQDADGAKLLSLVKQACKQIDKELSPRGYNITSNIGHAAGQTIFHLHVHVIPRYDGDRLKPEAGGGGKHKGQ